MAQVHGFLREDKATKGEKVVLKHLEEHLPKEYSVYVECPLRDTRQLRYPDFIVLTNYGVIVLEVKDWVEIVNADKFDVKIRTRANTVRTEHNPVVGTREFAILLNNELSRISRGKRKLNVPWGFAVILPNLPTSTITRLRSVWGDEFVLNISDLKPNIVNKRLRNTISTKHIHALNKEELDLVRATINPVVYIEQPERTVILDEDQEIIVTETVKDPPGKQLPESPPAEQMQLLPEEEKPSPGETKPDLLDYEGKISQNTAIRLIRGIAGSGKSLVLSQRARYLATQYPEWKLLVLTYNKELRAQLETRFRGIPNIRTRHFHGICANLMRKYRKWKAVDPDGWVKGHIDQFPIIRELKEGYISDEIEWLIDRQVSSLDEYLTIKRKTRSRHLGANQRKQVWEVYEAYKRYLEAGDFFDWAEIPHILMRGIDEGEIKHRQYDVILIDEAQDFAPGWINMMTRFLSPDGGVLFLADDPTQSIYRLYSWREKGVEVVGRTRWLKVPYRNTYEVYQTAYQMIASDKSLLKDLEDEGVMVTPDEHRQIMRNGPKPLLQRFDSFDEELEFVKNKIFSLCQAGISSRQIAVLHRRKKGLVILNKALRGTGVHVNTFHAYKGMEFEAVFLCQVQETDTRGLIEEARKKERRLIYMAMTRAREHLYMGYQGRLPNNFSKLDGFVDIVV
jgi:hypothetical protein